MLPHVKLLLGSSLVRTYRKHKTWWTMMTHAHLALRFLRFKSFIMVLSILHSKLKEKTNKTLVPHTAWTCVLWLMFCISPLFTVYKKSKLYFTALPNFGSLGTYASPHTRWILYHMPTQGYIELRLLYLLSWSLCFGIKSTCTHFNTNIKQNIFIFHFL